EARNESAITARPFKGSIITHLVVGERAHKQVSTAHIGQSDFCVRRAEHKLIADNAGAKVGREVAPQLKQARTMVLSLSCPIGWVTAQRIGQLLPEKCRALPGWGLRGIEESR